MVLLDDDVYQETKKIPSGKMKKGKLLTELSNWFMETYAAKILNIQYTQLPRSTRYRLYVVIENTKDYEKMYDRPLFPNKEYQQQIANEFQRLALKHKFTDEAKLTNLFVIYNNFSEEARTEANWNAIKVARGYIEQKYSSVWRVHAQFSSSVVFYHSEIDISTNASNGVSQSIKADYYSILKKYDELNYFTFENLRMKFDSKENLDKNYEGNLFYYDR